MNTRHLTFACLAVALGLAIPARAADAPVVQARRLTITLFDATYDVGVDGAIDVVERITVRFEGSWNGIYRWIPVKYELTDGGRHQIYLDVRAVEDDGGRELRHEVDREGALVKIKTWVPGARDAERTIVYRYRVENGLRYFEGDEEMQWAHDELYWNVTGDEWEMPILRVRARSICRARCAASEPSPTLGGRAPRAATTSRRSAARASRSRRRARSRCARG